MDSSPREKVLVSACLLGCDCRYNAEVRTNDALLAELESGAVELVPVCPEVAGGLPTPRPAADIIDGDGGDVLEGRARVVDAEGHDVTDAFLAGARAALEAARSSGARRAILKSRSPSCGIHTLSTMNGGSRPGNGVTAELLRRAGLLVESAGFSDAETLAP